MCAAICLSGVSQSENNLVADTLPVTTLPGEPSTASVRNLQRKAQKNFERGQYARAHRIYLKSLAPKGDKFAHYMIGHLHQHGLGVPRDPARAVAWYALAAERGSERAGVLGTQLRDQLSASEQERVEVIFAELRERYGDRHLLAKAIQRDRRELMRRTGSYLGGGTSPMILVTGDGVVTGDTYYQALEARIEYRTQMLGGTVTLGEFELIEAPEEESQEGETP